MFNSNEELVYHLQCHNSKKSFSCIECENKYSYRTALKKRMNSHKIEKLTYACSICGYKCENQIKLTNHQTAHSSEGKFRCDKCELLAFQSFLHLNIKENKVMVIIMNAWTVIPHLSSTRHLQSI
ncbi:unnamed protein product [Meganyctiphanes norvegica]|uniref:C2H2-type domain-containing protein n=1 Tax=Meganyctiphanes norvegica TaxID=48144 RepID=A0AAV2SMX7_MEGNR